MTDTRILSVSPLELVVTSTPQQTRGPLVTVVPWAYRVDYGSGVRPQYHTVSKLKRCHCVLGPDCPAVLAVAEYLKAGGERAVDPPFDFWPWVPDPCPICGARAEVDPGLNSPQHGLGWRCARSGGWCYWAARTIPLMACIFTSAAQVVPGVEPNASALESALARMRSWLPEPNTAEPHSMALKIPGA